MAANYRCTFVFEAVGMGFSDTWCSKSIEESALGPNVKKLVELRLAMLSSRFRLQGVRLSQMPPGVFNVQGIRASRLLVPGVNSYPSAGVTLTLDEVGTFGAESAVNPVEQFRSNLQVRLRFGGARSTTRYIVGVADGLSFTTAGTINPGTAVDWLKAFSDWRAEVLLNWGLIARSGVADDPYYDIQAWTRKTVAPLQLGFVIPTPTPLDWSSGTLIALEGVRVKKDQPKVSLNGRYHISSVLPETPSAGLSTIFLRELDSVEPAIIKILGKVRRVRKSVYYPTLMDTVRLGVHKRGKPALSPRGRRLTRTSLDP